MKHKKKKKFYFFSKRGPVRTLAVTIFRYAWYEQVVKRQINVEDWKKKGEKMFVCVHRMLKIYSTQGFIHEYNMCITMFVEEKSPVINVNGAPMDAVLDAYQSVYIYIYNNMYCACENSRGERKDDDGTMNIMKNGFPLFFFRALFARDLFENGARAFAFFFLFENQIWRRRVHDLYKKGGVYVILLLYVGLSHESVYIYIQKGAYYYTFYTYTLRE